MKSLHGNTSVSLAPHDTTRGPGGQHTTMRNTRAQQAKARLGRSVASIQLLRDGCCSVTHRTPLGNPYRIQTSRRSARPDDERCGHTARPTSGSHRSLRETPRSPANDALLPRTTPPSLGLQCSADQPRGLRRRRAAAGSAIAANTPNGIPWKSASARSTQEPDGPHLVNVFRRRGECGCYRRAA